MPAFLLRECAKRLCLHSTLQECDNVLPEDYNMLADMIAFGDGGFFCDRIVTPVFDVMAYEVG